MMHRFTVYFFFAFFVCSLLCPFPAGAEQSETYYDMGVYAFEEKMYEISEAHFLQALQQDPANGYCHHYLGQICLLTDRYKEAERYFNTAWEKNRDISGLEYDIAFLKFKMGAFTEAAQLFEKMVSEDSSHVMAIYYAGMSLLGQKQYESALDYLLDAADRNQSIKTNALYFSGICLKNMGRLDEAALKMTYVSEYASKKWLQDGSKKQLLLIQKKSVQTKPYQLHFTTGTGYDNNVTLESLDDDIYSNEADWFADAYLYANYNFVSQDRYQIGAGFGHHQLWHKDLDAYDMSGTIANLHLMRFYQSFAIGLTCSPGIYYADDKKYLTRHTITPALIWNIDKKLTAAVSYDYSDNTYHRVSGRDGRTHEVSADIGNSFFNDTVDATFSLGYEDTSASVSFYGYTRIKTGLNFLFKLPMDVNVDLIGKYNIRDYDSMHLYYNKKRKDDGFSGSMILSRSIFYPWLTMSAKLSYEKNNSNIDDFAYQRTVTGMFISADF